MKVLNNLKSLELKIKWLDNSSKWIESLAKSIQTIKTLTNLSIIFTEEVEVESKGAMKLGDLLKNLNNLLSLIVEIVSG